MKFPKTDEERRELIKRLAAKEHAPGEVVTRGTGRVSEEFWKLPRLQDPEGLLLEAFLEDRREGR